MSIFDQFRLDGQVALITGSGKGIGAEIARTFAEAGANIVLCSRTEADLRAVAIEIEAMGRKVLIVPTDIMQDEQRDSLIEECFNEFGRLDILVNNTGGTAPGPALDSSIELFENSFRFNVSTAFDMSIKCAPRMVETAGGGSIINISSIAGHKPTPCFSVYGTAKGALSILTQELAQDFAPKIRVNAIAVGSTKTDALNTVLDEGIEQAMVELTPMNRLGEVEDVAIGALYLASPASSYVTGDILGVNGGLERLNMRMPRAFGGST